MDTNNKTQEQFVVWVNAELSDTIRDYCQKNDVKISELFRKSVRKYLGGEQD